MPPPLSNDPHRPCGPVCVDHLVYAIGECCAPRRAKPDGAAPNSLSASGPKAPDLPGYVQKRPDCPATLRQTLHLRCYEAARLIAPSLMRAVAPQDPPPVTDRLVIDLAHVLQLHAGLPDAAADRSPSPLAANPIGRALPGMDYDDWFLRQIARARKDAHHSPDAGNMVGQG